MIQDIPPSDFFLSIWRRMMRDYYPDKTEQEIDQMMLDDSKPNTYKVICQYKMNLDKSFDIILNQIYSSPQEAKSRIVEQKDDLSTANILEAGYCELYVHLSTHTKVLDFRTSA